MMQRWNQKPILILTLLLFQVACGFEIHFYDVTLTEESVCLSNEGGETCTDVEIGRDELWNITLNDDEQLRIVSPDGVYLFEQETEDEEGAPWFFSSESVSQDLTCREMRRQTFELVWDAELGTVEGILIEVEEVTHIEQSSGEVCSIPERLLTRQSQVSGALAEGF